MHEHDSPEQAIAAGLENSISESEAYFRQRLEDNETQDDQDNTLQVLQSLSKSTTSIAHLQVISS